MRKQYTVILISLTFILILLWLLIITPSAYASPLTAAQESGMTVSGSGSRISAAPDNRPLSSLEEVVEWHNAPWVWGEAPILAKDIIVNRPVTLSRTAKPKELGAIEYVIRVTAGGSLTLDNPNLIIQGPQAVIIVEPGGLLLLQKGAVYTGPGDAIVVEKGGQLIKSADFLVDSGKILDKNDGNEPPTEPDSNLPPTEPETDPAPPTEPALPAILNTTGLEHSLSCLLGEPPAPSDYPSVKLVIYETAPNVPVQKELPVQWELDAVDFETAGTYTVKGIFTAEILAANGLSNPNNISTTLQLTVLKPGALDTLSGNVLSVGSKGRCLIQLTLPPLPEGATALYIYRSADGQSWQKAVRETYMNGNIPSSEDNFLPHAVITPKNLYVQYYYQTDYRPIWLRVEVVGSAVSGISNEIKLEMPSTAKPGDSIHTGENDDNDASGGNRGGGGQNEGDRVISGAQEKPSEDKTLPTDKTSAAGGQFPSARTPGQIPGTTTAPEDFAADETYWGGSGGGAFSQGGNVESSPSAAMPSDAEDQEGADSASLSKQETEPAVPEAEAWSDGAESSLQPQKSKGVLFTAEATALAAAGLLLLRYLYNIRKKRP